MKFKFLLIIIIIYFNHNIYCGIADPLSYPNESTVSNSYVTFVWEDIYKTSIRNTKYKIIIEGNGKKVIKSITPDVKNNRLYFFRLKNPLTVGDFTYSIVSEPERRYFGYRKYPINGNFKIDTNTKNPVDFASPENTAQYLYLDYYNKSENFNNALFYLGASTASLGIGLGIYFFLNFNIYTQILSYTFLAAPVIGYPLSGYYFYKYNSNKRKYSKLIFDNNNEINISLENNNLKLNIAQYF